MASVLRALYPARYEAATGKARVLRPAGCLGGVAQGLAGMGERARANYHLLSSLGPEALLAPCVQQHGSSALGLQQRLGLLIMSRKEGPARESIISRRQKLDLVLVRAQQVGSHQHQIQPVASNRECCG